MTYRRTCSKRPDGCLTTTSDLTPARRSNPVAKANRHSTPRRLADLTGDQKLKNLLGIAGLPALRDSDKEARALPIVEAVEPGHMLWHVLDDRHAPHLKEGDWAVIDTTDRKITWGELH